MIFFDSLKDKKESILKKENIFFLIFIVIIFLLDRYSKLKVINKFSDNVYYINDYINFDLIWNIGIGFGLLSTNTSLFYNTVTLLIAIVLLILIYIFFNSQKIDKFIFSIIIGGATGNFYDRISYNAVPDFIDLHYNNFHWFTFNVADIFITIGILAFIIRSFFVKN